MLIGLPAAAGSIETRLVLSLPGEVPGTPPCGYSSSRSVSPCLPTMRSLEHLCTAEQSAAPRYTERILSKMVTADSAVNEHTWEAYMTLSSVVCDALQESPAGCLTLDNIYKYIKRNFTEHRSMDGWQIKVRKILNSKAFLRERQMPGSDVRTSRGSMYMRNFAVSIESALHASKGSQDGCSAARAEGEPRRRRKSQRPSAGAHDMCAPTEYQQLADGRADFAIWSGLPEQSAAAATPAVFPAPLAAPALPLPRLFPHALPFTLPLVGSAADCAAPGALAPAPAFPSEMEMMQYYHMLAYQPFMAAALGMGCPPGGSAWFPFESTVAPQLVMAKSSEQVSVHKEHPSQLGSSGGLSQGRAGGSLDFAPSGGNGDSADCISLSNGVTQATMPLVEIKAARIRTMSEELYHNAAFDEEELLDNTSNASAEGLASPADADCSGAAPGIWEHNLSTELEKWRELGQLLCSSNTVF